MIKDERYSGVLLYKGKKYTNIVPPIVTKSIQNKAIDSLKVGRSRKNYRYIYDNIIYCANCNKVMTGTSGKGRKYIIIISVKNVMAKFLRSKLMK